ncbi:hypothetical protein KW94_08470 [Clostridioides difficile]|nr:hypothetical protein KW94_08470 [Clostridioides difficile]
MLGADYIKLPKEYWKEQRFCWYIYDVIASILKDCEKKERRKINLKFKTEAESKAFATRAENSKTIIDAMYENGYKDEARRAMGIDIFRATLSDMCQFICESLSAIEKQKISVSFALLRKPFRDNLLYLEWLLSNPNDFIDLVYKQDIDKYAIEKISKENKIEIIKSAIRQIKYKKTYLPIIDNKDLYDIRYNYNSTNSLQLIWNKANHLVTTHRKTRTDELNFTFLEEKDYLEYTDYFYSKIPILLFYTYNVVVELYNKFFRKLSDITISYNNLYVLNRYLDIVDGEFSKKYLQYIDDDNKITFCCEECEKFITVDKDSKEYKEFMFNGYFDCPNCKNEINVCRYIFLENYFGEGFEKQI